MAIPNSGTQAVVNYDTRTLIDRAYGALGVLPQQISGEKIQIAQDLLSLVLTDLLTTATPLWTLQKHLQTLTQGQQQYAMPSGTHDVQSAFYRTMTNITSQTAVTSVPASYTFDFGLGNAVQATTLSLTWSSPSVQITIQQSPDGVSWTTVAIGPSAVNIGVLGTLFYDLDNSNTARFYRAIPTNGLLTLGLSTAGLYNTPSEIEMYRMNKNDYWNLTNKTVQGRPLQYWVDRQSAGPVLDVWQVPDSTAAQNLMVVWRNRQIMDVGTLAQAIEVPVRWFYTAIFALADALSFVTPEAKPDRVVMVQQRAQQMLTRTWVEERDKSPIKFNVSLRQYTR